MTVDDDAARAEEIFLQAALQRRAAMAPNSTTPGRCLNCGGRCLPTVVYCDAGCREDHEHRCKLEQFGGRHR